jgi:membrane-associated phospholipid phosphatase
VARRGGVSRGPKRYPPTVIPALRPPSRSLLVAAGTCFAAAATSILTIDQPVARALAGWEPIDAWREVMTVLEYAIGLPVFRWFSAIVLVVAMLVTMAVPRWRRFTPTWIVLAATHVLTQVATSHLKEATSRLRPSQWLALGGEGDTFFQPKGVAFPSGHVALFGSLVIPLVVVFPRLRPLIAIVVFVMAARVVAHAHWISDVVATVGLTLLVIWLVGWAMHFASRPRASR